MDPNDDENEADNELLSAFVRAVAAMAQSNCVLMNTRNTEAEYNIIDYYVLNTKYWYTNLCNAAVEGIANNLRTNLFRNRVRPNRLPLQSSRRSSMFGAISAITEGRLEDVEEDIDNIIVEDEEGGIVAAAAIEVTTIPNKKAKKYIAKALRPNVHVGVYYSDLYK